jgi:ribokinase
MDSVGGAGRYLEDMQRAVQPTVADVRAARETIARATFVVVQLQQPTLSAVTAADLVRGPGCRVVLSGAPADDDHRQTLLRFAHVLRADPHEAELLTGVQLGCERDVLRAARDLLRQGPDLVAPAVEGGGNLFAWPDGNVFFPLDDAEAIDTTGAGDALVADVLITSRKPQDLQTFCDALVQRFAHAPAR